jgi:hypothetical protein
VARVRRTHRKTGSSVGLSSPERIAVFALLAVMAVQLALAARWDGMTVDEMPYIGCGYRALVASDYRMMPEHPPVAKILVALPLLFLTLDVPPPQDGDAQITWSDEFLNVRNRDRPILGASRTMIGLLTVLMGFVLWRMARRLYGAAAAMVALALLA